MIKRARGQGPGAGGLRARITVRVASTAMLLAIVAPAAMAQSIAERVAAVNEGTVRISFNTRPDVCGRGSSIMHGEGSRTNWGSDRANRDLEWDAGCEYGPGRLVLQVRDREIVGLRFYIGGRWRAGEGVTDLGMVSAKDAAEYLVSLAATGTGRASREAIFPATLADSVVIWPRLVRIARDEERPRATREQAVFWLGQMAGEVATANLDSIVRDDGVNREIREQAVFALSQRPNDEGVPALIRVAKTNSDPEVRKKALFWLGQSGDKRAVDLFEELLGKP